jgi:hypothetical protein
MFAIFLSFSLNNAWRQGFQIGESFVDSWFGDCERWIKTSISGNGGVLNLAGAVRLRGAAPIWVRDRGVLAVPRASSGRPGPTVVFRSGAVGAD